MLEYCKRYLNHRFFLTGVITYCFAFVTMIIIPVYHWFLPPFMILWGLFWLIEIRTRTNDLYNIKLQYRLLFILFILFFTWQIVGMLYSENPKEGWRNITLRLSLFLFPLVLLSPGEMIRKKITSLLRLFAISTFFYLAICFGYALFRSLSFQNGILIFNPHLPVYTWLNYFYASELSILQHPSYISMFALLSVFIGFESFFDRLIPRHQRIIWLGVSLILFVSIYFLSSRAEIFTALIIVPVYVFRRLKSVGKNKYLGVSLVVILLVLFSVLLTNPRVNKYLKLRSAKELTDMTLKEGRITIWNTVINIMKHNIFLGVGTGDIQEELNKEYVRIGNIKLAEGNFNAHNQYIEVILENGLIGLVLFLSMFGLMFYISISERNLIYFIFILIVLFSFMFETMLNRLAGGAFFSMFSFLMIHISGSSQTIQAEIQKQIK